MADDLVERVARAIYARAASKDSWDRRSDAFKVSWRRDAKAALKASLHTELVELLREADECAWPEAVILIAHTDPARQKQAKEALYAWREKAKALLAKIGGDA